MTYAQKTPPSNMEKLLWLGTEFCVQQKTLDMSKFKYTITRFEYDVRVKCCVVITHGFYAGPPHASNIQQSWYVHQTLEGAMKIFEKISCSNS